MLKKYEHLYKREDDFEKSFLRLVNIVSILRKKCPWDREQNHETLIPCLIEESYEVVEAINKKDDENLREELGDVLLQIVFHSILGDEDGTFTINDVINDECEKMIRRHPHVFLNEEHKSVDKVLEKWENIKSKEHESVSYTQRLKDVPKALPALLHSRKVQKRASDIGFDWDDIKGPMEKVSEELSELHNAIICQDEKNINEELGDLLFSVVNVARFLKVDPEKSLKDASAKFIERFEKVENLANERGFDLKDMTLSELDEIWKEIK